MTIGLWDIADPGRQGQPGSPRPTTQVADIDGQFQRGLITDDERYEQVVDLWQKTTKDVSDAMMATLPDGQRPSG